MSIMLFQNETIKAIEMGLRELEERNLSLETVKLEKLIDFYENYQIGHYLKGYGFDDEQGNWIIPQKNINITEKVIHKISTLYKNPPHREILETKNEEMTERWQEWVDYQKGRFDMAMKQLERYTELTHLALFRPIYHPDLKQWLFYIETAFEPHFTEDLPLHPFAYSIPIKIDTVHHGDRQEIKWLFISKENYFFHDQTGKIQPAPGFENTDNPFGILPLIESRRSMPVNQYEVAGAIDLVNSNHQLNVNLMNLDLILMSQAFGLFYENSGVPEQEWRNMKIAPNRMTHLPREASMEVLDPNPKIGDCINAIKFEMELLEATYNIKIQWSIEGNPASGFSLLIQNIDLLEDREDAVLMGKMREYQIYDVIATMQQYYKNAGLLDKKEPMLMPGAKTNILFAEIDFPIEQAQEIERIEHEYKWGKRTPVEDIMQDKGVNKEEAMKIYKENMEIMDRLSTIDQIRAGLQETEPTETVQEALAEGEAEEEE